MDAIIACTVALMHGDCIFPGDGGSLCYYDSGPHVAAAITIGSSSLATISNAST